MVRISAFTSLCEISAHAVLVACCLSCTSFSSEAALPHCAIYFRGDSLMPNSVGKYLSGSHDAFVEGCPRVNSSIESRIDESLAYSYFGGTAVDHVNGICSYVLYPLKESAEGGLNLVRNGSGQEFMHVYQAACPPPSIPSTYVATTEISADDFQDVMKLWSKSILSQSAFENAFSQIASDPNSRDTYIRLRRQLFAPSPRTISIQRIYSGSGAMLWRRFNVKMNDPEDASASYVVTVSAFFGHFLKITRLVRVLS
jgi:hypothetical protein